MSQIVAAYSMSWIALAGDRSISWSLPDGTKNRALHHDSKIQIVPGLPFAIAVTGPAYGAEVADAYIQQRFDPTKRRTECANELWAELCAYHDEHNGALVHHNEPGMIGGGDCGLEALTQASMSMLVADARGIAGIFTAEYPSREPACASTSWFGGLCGYGSGIIGMGVHNFHWKVNFGRMGAKGGVDTVRAVLDSIEGIEAVRSACDSDAFTIMKPYDIVLLTHTGVEYIERAEVQA